MFFAVLVAVSAAGCYQIGTGPATHAGGRQGLNLQVGNSRVNGWTTGDRLATVVTATASGQVSTTDAETRRHATTVRSDAEATAINALATGYSECMRDEDSDAMICGAPFVAAAASGSSGGIYTPYGMAGGFPTRTVRALQAVQGGYAPIGSYPNYGGGRRGGEAVDSVARQSVVELAGALREHTEGGGR